MTSVLTGSITVMSSFAAKDLNMTNAQITWMNAACSLSAGALLLFFGSIADLFGRKSLFIGSMVLFSIVTLGTGFAKDGITIDVLCGILGIFSASVVPPAQGMLGTIYDKPSRRKNRAFGCFSAGNPLGFVFGTILSGLFTQVFNWRAGFYFIAITYFITSMVAFLCVPTDTMPKQTLNSETLKKLDLPGTGMTIAGIGMFCAALSLAGDAPNGWKTPYVLVLLLVGLLLIGGFIVWELKYTYAIVDMNVFRDRDFSLVSNRGDLNPQKYLLTGVASPHSVIGLPRFPSILFLDRALLPDRTWVRRPYDRCAHATYGRIWNGGQCSRGSDSAQGVQQAHHGHWCLLVCCRFRPCCSTAKGRFVLGVLVPCPLSVRHWSGLRVHCRKCEYIL